MKQMKAYYKVVDFGGFSISRESFEQKDYKFVIPHSANSWKIIEYFPVEIREEKAQDKCRTSIRILYESSKYFHTEKLEGLKDVDNYSVGSHSFILNYNRLMKKFKSKFVIEKDNDEKEGVYINQKKHIEDNELIFTDRAENETERSALNLENISKQGDSTVRKQLNQYDELFMFIYDTPEDKRSRIKGTSPLPQEIYEKILHRYTKGEYPENLCWLAEKELKLKWKKR